jgi:hypothetical protein
MIKTYIHISFDKFPRLVDTTINQPPAAVATKKNAAEPIRSIEALKAGGPPASDPIILQLKTTYRPASPYRKWHCCWETVLFLVLNIIHAICYVSVIILYHQGPSIAMVVDEELMR